MGVELMSRTRRMLRALDREERNNRGVPSGRCYFCAISGQEVEASNGQLCERHFVEVTFPRVFPISDY